MNRSAICAWVVGALLFLIPSLSLALEPQTQPRVATEATTTERCILKIQLIQQVNTVAPLLSWTSSTSTQTASISGIGSVATSGRLFITPTQSTTFTGTFIGPLGTAHCYATVIVQSQNAGGSAGAYQTGSGGSSGTYQSLVYDPTTGTYEAGTYTAPTGYDNPGGYATSSYDTPGYNTPSSGYDPGSYSQPGGYNPGTYTIPTGPSSGPVSTAGISSVDTSGGKGLVSCTGVVTCDLCALVQLFQNLINFFVGLSIPIAVAAFGYAGVLYFTSAANPSNIARAKKVFISTLVGFVIAISGWLVVQTVMNVLVVGFGSNWSWNHLDCRDTSKLRQKTINGTIEQWLGSLNGANDSGTPVSGGSVTPTNTNGGQSGPVDEGPPNPGPITQEGDLAGKCSKTPISGPPTIPNRICNQARAYIGASSRNAPIPGGGENACAWTADNVLTNAGLAPITPAVADWKSRLSDGTRGHSINQRDAQCGDIVISQDVWHVAICMNQGCTITISNGSTPQSFTLCSDPDFKGLTREGISTFYRVTN